MHRQLITIEDRTSPDTLDANELFNLCWALNTQAHYHYGNSPWVNAGRAPSAQVLLLPHDESGIVKPPPDAWNLILLDTTDQEGALGYHDDDEGNKIPYSEVFCKTAKDDGAAPSEVASHEMLEMLVDPDVNNVRTARHAGKLYIMEVCDPTQGEGYDVGAPAGRTTGTIVANFVLPAYFGLPQPVEPHAMSYRPGAVTTPFALAPDGYISVAPEGEPTNWTQLFGASKTEALAAGAKPHELLPAWASRLPKIHGLRLR